MSDPGLFQQAFGATLAHHGDLAGHDPALARALTIHRNTSAKAAQDALADNYPVVRQLCGDEAFAACAAAFVAAQPPREPRLCLYGVCFDQFVGDYPPFEDLAYLADVATLERLCVEALFAADAKPLDGRAVAEGLDLQRPLRLHPATRFSRFASPAADIWLAHQPEAARDALDQLDWRPGAALVTRPADALMVAEIDLATWVFLDLSAAGRPLGEAAETAAEAGADLSLVFSNLITAGAFA